MPILIYWTLGLKDLEIPRAQAHAPNPSLSTTSSRGSSSGWHSRNKAVFASLFSFALWSHRPRGSPSSGFACSFRSFAGIAVRTTRPATFSSPGGTIGSRGHVNHATYRRPFSDAASPEPHRCGLQSWTWVLMTKLLASDHPGNKKEHKAV